MRKNRYTYDYLSKSNEYAHNTHNIIRIDKLSSEELLGILEDSHRRAKNLYLTDELCEYAKQVIHAKHMEHPHELRYQSLSSFLETCLFDLVMGYLEEDRSQHQITQYFFNKPEQVNINSNVKNVKRKRKTSDYAKEVMKAGMENLEQ